MQKKFDIEFGKGISGWNVETEEGERKMAVGRDYKVKFAPGAVADDAGVWLQGCCEGTHGVSEQSTACDEHSDIARPSTNVCF